MSLMSYGFDKTNQRLGFNETVSVLSNILECLGLSVKIPEREKPDNLRALQQEIRFYGHDYEVSLAHVHCMIRHNLGYFEVIPTERTRRKDVRMIRKINNDLNIFVNPRYKSDAKSWGMFELEASQEEKTIDD